MEEGEKTEAHTNEAGPWASEANFAEGMKGDIGLSEDQSPLLCSAGKFAGEIATFGFDELKFAKGISEVFNPTVNRALDIVKPQSGLSKFLEESAQRLASKTFEQTVTNAIEGQGLPTPGEISARAVQAMAMGYFKVLTPKVVDKPTVFSSPAERFRKNVANIIINGPPPKSAIGFALTKDMTDLFRKGIGGASGPEIAVGMLKTASISVAGSLTVAASMGAVQGREARRAKELEIKHPDLVHGDIDPAAYRVYAREIRGLRGLPGTVVPSYREWAARHAGQKIYIEGNDLVVPDCIELGGRAKSEKLKTMDEVMNPDRR